MSVRKSVISDRNCKRHKQLISTSIDIGLSITPTFKQKAFLLVRAQLNRRSSRLERESSFQAHSGSQTTFLRFFCTAVPISMGSSQIKTYKTRMHPLAFIQCNVSFKRLSLKKYRFWKTRRSLHLRIEEI